MKWAGGCKKWKMGVFFVKSGKWGVFGKKGGKWGVFFVSKWTFSQRRVHYVQ